MKLYEQRRLAPDLDIEGVDEHDLAALARVITATAHVPDDEIGIGDPEGAQQDGAQLGLGMFKTEADFSQSQHAAAV